MFALGNSSYPSFCGFGTWLDSALSELSGTRLAKIRFGDELGDRDNEYKKWSQMVYRQACLEANLDLEFEPNRILDEPDKIVTKWLPLDHNDLGVGLSKCDIRCRGN